MTARAIGAILPKRLTGNDRGHDKRVWRESYDVNDRAAQVFSRISDGSPAGAKAWIDAMIRVAKEYSLHAPKRRGSQGVFTHATLRVLEELLRGHWVNFKSGQIDPALSQLQKATGLARSTVQRALETLRGSGFICWVRRSAMQQDEHGNRRRRQVTNGYFVDIRKLPGRVARRLEQLLGLAKRRRASEPTLTSLATLKAEQPALRPQNAEMAAILARMEEGIIWHGESRVPGKSPTSGMK